MHFTSTKSLPTSTAEENPERRFPSTYRCMAACAVRKSYPVAVTFMSSTTGFLVLATTRLTPNLSIHDSAPREKRRKSVRLRSSESALGQKQTCAAHKPMSAKCQKRT
jgi:hypothetical protein